jgi:hypothetical protein
MMEPAVAGDPAPRAFLRVGGANLARHQLVLALLAKCERVICFARDFSPELITLQHEAERGGARFHVVPGPRGLSGLITAADEVLILAEGLLPTTGDALRLLDGPQAVFIQPAESGVPAGFERIDLNHASAGLMLVPGRLVDRLMEMPADTDPGSALLRIALQAGVAQRPVPDETRIGGRWLMVRSEDEAHAAENAWMNRHTAGGPATPGPLLGRWLVRQFGPALLHGGGGSGVVAIIALVLALIGLALAWFGYISAGLGITGVGWILRGAAAMLARVQRESLSQRSDYPLRRFLADAVFDLVLIAILTLALPALPGQMLIERGFAPTVLIGLLRLLPRAFPGGWSDWAEDRMVLVMLLVVLALGRVLAAGVPGLVALLLIAGLVLPRAEERLTRA